MNLKSLLTKSLVWGRGIKIKQARNKSELEKIFKFRFQIYLKEGYIDKKDCPSGMLVDKYDPVATSFYAEKGGKVVGTLRLIPFSEIGFPTENAFNLSKNFFLREETVEVSKFCVEPTLRGQLVSLGMLEKALEYSLKSGKKYWLFGIPAKLRKYFEGVGVRFIELGVGESSQSHLAERRTAKKYFEQAVIRPFLLDLSEITRQ